MNNLNKAKIYINQDNLAMSIFNNFLISLKKRFYRIRFNVIDLDSFTENIALPSLCIK